MHCLHTVCNASLAYCILTTYYALLVHSVQRFLSRCKHIKSTNVAAREASGVGDEHAEERAGTHGSKRYAEQCCRISCAECRAVPPYVVCGSRPQRCSVTRFIIKRTPQIPALPPLPPRRCHSQPCQRGNLSSVQTTSLLFTAFYSQDHLG